MIGTGAWLLWTELYLRSLWAGPSLLIFAFPLPWLVALAHAATIALWVALSVALRWSSGRWSSAGISARTHLILAMFGWGTLLVSAVIGDIERRVLQRQVAGLAAAARAYEADFGHPPLRPDRPDPPIHGAPQVLGPSRVPTGRDDHRAGGALPGPKPGLVLVRVMRPRRAYARPMYGLKPTCGRS